MVCEKAKKVEPPGYLDHGGVQLKVGDQGEFSPFGRQISSSTHQGLTKLWCVSSMEMLGSSSSVNTERTAQCSLDWTSDSVN